MVRRIKDRTRSRFNLAVTEVGGQDTWQRVVLGFALVGNDREFVDSTVEKVVRFVEGMGVAEISGEDRETLHYTDDSLAVESSPGGQDADWIPSQWLEEGGASGGEGESE